MFQQVTKHKKRAACCNPARGLFFAFFGSRSLCRPLVLEERAMLLRQPKRPFQHVENSPPLLCFFVPTLFPRQKEKPQKITRARRQASAHAHAEQSSLQ